MNVKIIFIVLTICIGCRVSLKFEPMDQKTGLTFVKLSSARISYDTYTILYYIDIDQYKNKTKMVENFTTKSKHECKRLTSSTCDIMLNQATILLNHMKRNESDIEAYQQKYKNNGFDERKKRALEFVGDFFHWAFGTMNAETARKYDRKIESLQGDSKRFHNLLREQTVLIKETLTLNNKTYNDMQKQLKKMSQEVQFYIDQLFSKFNWAQAELVFTEGSTMIKMLESEHRRLTLQILRCLEDTVSGKITQVNLIRNGMKSNMRDYIFHANLILLQHDSHIDCSIDNHSRLVLVQKIL